MGEISANIKDRILQIPKYKGIALEDFFKGLGVSYGNFKGKSKMSALASDVLAEISTKYPDVNTDWLLTGSGTMLRRAEVPTDYGKRNLIPLYNDVTSIGGNNGLVDNGTNTQQPELIDAGDWFPGASAAIRHYGDSMREYPSGSILALKVLKEVPRGFVLGQNYVVEYGEDYNRVTKRVQKKGDTYMAYSSNEDKYDDGTLIHQPFELYNIQRAWRVLGCVIKTESSRGVIPVGRV